jgi:hypothetical protein
MSESNDYRRNAATRAAAGGALVGAGAGLKSRADKKYKVKNGTVTRNFTIIGPDGLPAGTHSVLEDKMVNPDLKHAIKGKKLTPKHAKFLSSKLAARSVQGVGLGLVATGGKQFYDGQQNEKFNVKREVVRPLVYADAIQSKINQRVNKNMTDEEKLSRSKNRTRHYLQVGGTIGGTALLLRAPEFAGALKHAPKSKILRRVSELEPKTTKASNSLLAVGSGIGAFGAFNSAQMQKLENKKFKELNGVSKRDDKFVRQYGNRISPQAEEGYKHLRRGAQSRYVESGASGALGAGLLAYSVKDLKAGNRLGAGLSGLGGALTLKSAADNASAARAWNAKANKIKERAYQRERDGEWGKGRQATVAKTMWLDVEKGLSVGLPYPKGMRRAGIRPGHLRRTFSGKTISVRGSIG